MIESYIEGRVRLRSPIFAETDIAESLKALLVSVAGVLRVDFNPRTQGMLLEYDPARVPQTMILKAAPLLERMDRLNALAHAERRSGAEGLLRELKELLGGHPG